MKKHLDLAFKFRKHDFPVLSFGGLPTMMCPMLPRLSYVYIGIIFLMAQFPPQQCHGGKTPRNSSLRNSSSIKSGISLYSSETVFFYKIFQKFVVFGHFGHQDSVIISHVSIVLTSSSQLVSVSLVYINSNLPDHKQQFSLHN